MFSIVIPCNNEELCIARCLLSVANQKGLPEDHRIEVIVSANGCNDQTVEIAKNASAALKASGFQVRVIDLRRPGKANAINAAELVASWKPRLYLDADVILAPEMLAAQLPLLTSDKPVFSSGTVACASGNSFASQAYAEVWSRLPFVANGVPGVGLYGVSEKGRKRWGDFPEIQSDDRYVRLQFSPQERQKVAQTYSWPVPQGFWNLVQVRRRWIEGNIELFHRYPAMRKHDDKKTGKSAMLKVFFQVPFDFQIFLLVWTMSYILARMKDPEKPVEWRRGRP